MMNRKQFYLVFGFYLALTFSSGLMKGLDQKTQSKRNIKIVSRSLKERDVASFHDQEAITAAKNGIDEELKRSNPEVVNKQNLDDISDLKKTLEKYQTVQVIDVTPSKSILRTILDGILASFPTILLMFFIENRFNKKRYDEELNSKLDTLKGQKENNQDKETAPKSSDDSLPRDNKSKTA